MEYGIRIEGKEIVFTNPRKVGLIGRQKNFRLPIADILVIGYLNTWFWDDEAELLVIIDSGLREYDINMHYISESFLKDLAGHTRPDLHDQIGMLCTEADRSAVLYDRSNKGAAIHAYRLRWTVGKKIKTLINIAFLKNPLFRFLKVP